jgi:uncharacterized phage infection (PIP) family protein YhgE
MFKKKTSPMSIFTVGSPGDYAGYSGGYSPARVGAYPPAYDAVFGAPLTKAQVDAMTLTDLKTKQASFTSATIKDPRNKEAAANLKLVEAAIAKKQAGGGAAAPAAAPAAGKPAAAPAAGKPAAAPAAGKPAAAPAAGKPSAPSVPRGGAVLSVAQKAAVCDSSEVTQKLEADNTLISKLKDSVQEETNRAATINAKVKELKTALRNAETALQKARDELGGKTDEHEGASAALAEAEESVKTCTSSIASVDANVGKLGSGLATLQGEIEALTRHQNETLVLLDETGAAKP